MIKGRLIVCVASSWDYDPTSKHQIMRILSRHNDILWVNYHGTRRPQANGRDLKEVCARLYRVSRGIQSAAPSIFQLTPLVIPGAGNRMLGRLHRHMLKEQVRRAIRKVNRGVRPIQLWTFAPDVPFLVRALGEECSLYYCVDEYTQFQGHDVDRLAAAESELLDRADIVITSSEPLWHAKRLKRPDAVLLRHGVDYEHFAAAWRSPPACPADLADVPRPVLGFFGLIHHWVDLDLLCEVARLRPGYSFVLIGECKTHASRLRHLSNVFVLGRRPYAQLPAYCAAFDAAMLLFTRSPMTPFVNPIKMYEYLAAGLPVVSTPLPEAERLSAPIIVAHGPERFAEACDHVLGAYDRGSREMISRLVAGETWASKVESLSRIISKRLNPRSDSITGSRQSDDPGGQSKPETVAATR